jgi:hypothetical protein
LRLSQQIFFRHGRFHPRFALNKVEGDQKIAPRQTAKRGGNPMNKREWFPKASNSFRQFLAAATRPLRLVGLAVVMVGLLGSTMALHASGGEEHEHHASNKIVGTWIFEVSFGGADCSLGDIVLYSCSYGLETFHADGTMAEVDTLIPPSQQSWGTGVWRADGPNKFAVTFEQLQFDSGGNPANYDIVWGPVTVSNDGQTWSASGWFASYNFDGTFIATPGYSGTFTATGTRMQVRTQPLP